MRARAALRPSPGGLLEELLLLELLLLELLLELRGDDSRELCRELCREPCREPGGVAML